MCILSNLHFPLEKILNFPALSSSSFKCVVVDEKIDINDHQINFVKELTFPFATTPLIEVPVSSADVLCEGDDIKTIIEVILDVSELDLKYLPGDTIGILPKNDKQEVDYILSRLGLIGSDKLKIELVGSKKKVLPAHIPPIFTVKYILESCLDLRAVVKKTFLRGLAEHTSDPTEKRRIIELCSREGAGEYNEYILKPKSSIIDVLLVFSSCNPPLSLLVEHIPRLQPRPYSIASSPLQDPGKLRVVFNVVYDSRNRRGICSGWLYDITRPLHDLNYKFAQFKLLNNGESTIIKIPFYLRKPTDFRIPESPTLPLIMIGPGTGVAPFIGFLEHRRQQLSFCNDKANNWVIFGCRHKDKDNIFRKMLLSMEAEHLCSYHVAYSRDEVNIHPKYVQDIMRLHQKDLVHQLLTTESVLFICGNGQAMRKCIIDALIQSVVSVRGITEEEANEVIVALEQNGQIVKELWI